MTPKETPKQVQVGRLVETTGDPMLFAVEQRAEAMTSPEDTQYAAELLRRSILRAAEGTPISAYAERLASDVIRHYQEACNQKTDEYDPRTCITAGELRAKGLLVPEAVPDCGWIPRGAFGVKASSAAVTQEDVDAGILRININYEFTQPLKI